MGEAKRFTSEEIVSIVNAIMVEEFEVDEAKLDAPTPLGDLGLDSLDGLDMVVAIEKAFSCRIPEEDAKSIRTLGDIYERVQSRLGVKEAV